MSNNDASSGVRPSELKAKYSNEPLVKKIPSQTDEIPDDEKLRLIDQTGILHKVKEEQTTTTGEYIWQAIFLSIPFGFLFATFDISVKVQYSEPWNYYGMVMKCMKSAPGETHPAL